MPRQFLRNLDTRPGVNTVLLAGDISHSMIRQPESGAYNFTASRSAAPKSKGIWRFETTCEQAPQRRRSTIGRSGDAVNCTPTIHMLIRTQRQPGLRRFWRRQWLEGEHRICFRKAAPVMAERAARGYATQNTPD